MDGTWLEVVCGFSDDLCRFQMTDFFRYCGEETSHHKMFQGRMCIRKGDGKGWDAIAVSFLET